MVIGEGNIVDESLVEVVDAVVEVCMATVNRRWCKNQTRPADHFKVKGVSPARPVLPQHGHGHAHHHPHPPLLTPAGQDGHQGSL